MLLLLFSFLAGFVTILAPCIWPVLPIILSASATLGKGRSRPFGITLGVMISFAFFTLSISFLVHIFHLDPNTLRSMAVVIIIFLGLTMIIPKLSARFEIFITRLSNLFGQKQNSGSGFLAGFITGLSLGIVWTPCAGPILATIATLAATGQVNLFVILVTVFYVLGVGVPLFAFAYGGQHLIAKLRKVNKFTGKIQKVFGVVMILAGVAIYTNYTQTLQLQLISQFPKLGGVINGFENSSAVSNELTKLTGKKALPVSDSAGLFNINTEAPDFAGITSWLNTNEPISLKDLKGKVVLVDFWTYTCINCIRTLPHVTSWYDKYKDKGFTVVGVHTPEFEFEKDPKSVAAAIKQYNIHYPVAQDNNYATWNAYANNYWPAEYLIDASGNIRRAEFGEGEYDKMEKAIQALLMDAGQTVIPSITDMPDLTPATRISPETYLGSGRNSFNPNLKLDGNWKIYPEYIESGENSSISYTFKASKVYIILRPSLDKDNKVKVYLDGKVIDPGVSGLDVSDGVVTVERDRLFNIVDLHDKTETHSLKLEFENSGIEAFTFTFG